MRFEQGGGGRTISGGGGFQSSSRSFHQKDSMMSTGSISSGSGRVRHGGGGGGGMPRAVRLKPPPVPKLYGDLPTKQNMLDVLGGSTCPNAPKIAGTQPFVQRHAAPEQHNGLSNRYLIQVGLRAQQIWRTDATPLATLIRNAFCAVVRTLGGVNTASAAAGKNMGASEEPTPTAPTPTAPAANTDSHIEFMVKENVMDHALMLVRDLDGLITLAEVYEQTAAANAQMEADVTALRAELENVREERRRLEQCDQTAQEVLQRRSVPVLQEKIHLEAEKVRIGLAEIENRRKVHEERTAQLRQIQEELKGVMGGLIAVQSSTKANPTAAAMINEDDN